MIWLFRRINLACWPCSVWSILRWVWLIFGEMIRRETLLGGGIVFAAVLVHLVRHNRRAVAR